MAKKVAPGRGRSKGTAPVSFPEAKRSRETLGDLKTRTTYTVKIPKNLRDDPDGIARYLDSLAREKHGTTKRDYHDRHFLATFTGIMYEEDDKESGRMGRGTFGTYANRSLAAVTKELRGRIEAVNEGQTPRQQGPASSYGYFANGVSEVSLIAMEEAEEIDSYFEDEPIEGEYEGARDVDGEPYLDFRSGDDLISVPARQAHMAGKLREGRTYKIDRVTDYRNMGTDRTYHWEIEED